jgi:hypothetical protein
VESDSERRDEKKVLKLFSSRFFSLGDARNPFRLSSSNEQLLIALSTLSCSPLPRSFSTSRDRKLAPLAKKKRINIEQATPNDVARLREARIWPRP